MTWAQFLSPEDLAESRRRDINQGMGLWDQNPADVWRRDHYEMAMRVTLRIGRLHYENRDGKCVGTTIAACVLSYDGEYITGAPPPLPMGVPTVNIREGEPINPPAAAGLLEAVGFQLEWSAYLATRVLDRTRVVT